MSLVNINRILSKRISKNVRNLSTITHTKEDEYTNTPEYPQILDLSYEKVKERKKLKEHEQVKAVKTVEEKQIKLNMSRYHGFKCFVHQEHSMPYNNLNHIRYITKTHLITKNELPEFYTSIDVNDNVFQELKSAIEEAILIENEICNTSSNESIDDIIGTVVSKQINRIVINKFDHLCDVQVDWEPRIESAWYVGGITPPEILKKARRGMEFFKDYENEPIDRLFYYIGEPILNLRSKLPLKPIIPYSEATNSDFLVPECCYDPRVLGVKIDHKWINSIPGFWPGDAHQFSLLSYHKRGYLLDRYKFYKDDIENKEALHGQGILASFAWLHSIANYMGFTTFNDITYPLVTQSVITNGKLWSFYVYQLNTMLFHSKNMKDNPKCNVCWATDEFKLYEEIKDGKIVGLNDDVLKMLVKMYVNMPEERLGVNMKPYLSQEEKIVADYQDEEKRDWLENQYKFLVSNRPRHKEIDEIYSWEKIYKIDHQTRPLEKRLRPFELFKQPWKRRLDERPPKYIPRALRPDLPRWKGRYSKDFFP